MNVALPEVDGRILPRAVSFKARGPPRSATAMPDRRLSRRCPTASPSSPRSPPPGSRLRATPAGRAPRRARPRQLPQPRRPHRQRRRPRHARRHGRAAAAHAAGRLSHRRAAPETADPDRGAARRRRPTPSAATRGRARRADRRRLASPTIAPSSPSLPARLRERSRASAGAPPDADPFCRRRRLPSRRPSLRQRRRRHPAGARLQHRSRPRPTTTRSRRRRTAISPSTPGCATSFGAHAVIHLGKHGNLEWLPGKALALSADCWPEAVLGPLPHLYPVHRQRSRARAPRPSAAAPR